ncbi:MAG TPA: hypothetical protein V6C57_19900 [Coleofasciculaceae cyanobacterium]
MLSKLADDLDLAYSDSDTWYVALIADTRSLFTFTANASTNTLTATGNNFIDGLPVQLTTTSALPAPLSTGTTYYVRDRSGDNFSLAATLGGSVIDLTNTGSGAHTITDLALDETVTSMAQWIRKEVSNYQGVSTRPQWMPSAATTDTIAKTATKSASVTLDNTSGGVSVNFDKALLIRNGSPAPGNTSGEVSDFNAQSLSIIAGKSYTLTIPITAKNV